MVGEGRMKGWAASALVAWGCGTAAVAQDAPAAAPAETVAKPRFTARSITDPVKVDGVLDDAAWNAPAMSIDYETEPGDNLPARVKTEFWVAYDQNHLYVAFRAHDPEPLAVRARLRDRDRAYSDDWVGIVVDAFNDERRGFEFLANPFGVQMDLARNDNTGEEDDSWDALWFSAGRLTATGYEVELEIPFSSLRFPASKDPMTWGFDAWRNYPRDKRYLMNWAPGKRGSNCFLCLIGKMDGIAGVAPSRNLEFDPTFTASATERRPLPAGDWVKDDESEPGLTARWGVTPNFTLNAAINPDFSQVEADVAQLDVNTRFALFYPEKRPFFLEGGDLFNTRINALYSRNIADPDWGLKFTGKQGPHALGVIVAQDAITNLLLPSSQFSQTASILDDNLSSMLRYRFDIGPQSSAGVIYSGRDGGDYSNQVIGVDTLFRWHGSDAVRVERLTSTTKYPNAFADRFGLPRGEFDGDAMRIAYQHDAPTWAAAGVYYDIDPGFRADLGFIPQVGFESIEGFAERRWFFDDRALSQIVTHVDWLNREDPSGNLVSRNYNASTQLRGKFQSFLHLRVGVGDQAFGGREFTDDSWGFYFESVPKGGVEVRLDGRFGDRVDYENVRQAHEDFLAPGVTLDLGRHLRLILDHARSDFSVEGRDLFTAELTQIRATYQLNIRSFIRLVSILERVEREPGNYTFTVSKLEEALANQLLFSYKVNPQTVLFLGYSDRHVSDGVEVRDLTQQGRTLFLKVGYAWLV
jgi:hypothetical protein